MTKSDIHIMQCEESLVDDERASNLARRIAVEEFALKYRISMGKAEKLLTNKSDAAVPTSPTCRDDLKARSIWSKAIDIQQKRLSTDEREDMDIDIDAQSRGITHGSLGHVNSFPLRGEELSRPHEVSPYKTEHSQAPGFVQTTSKFTPTFSFLPRSYAGTQDETHNRRNSALSFRPVSWPYYMTGHPYVTPMRMFPRGYPFLYSTVNHETQTMSSRARHESPNRVPYCRSVSNERDHPTTVTSETQRHPSQFPVRNRLVILPEARTLFRARGLDNHEETTDKLLATGTKIKANKDVLLTNSCRPSVLVMQRSMSNPPTSSRTDETISEIKRSRSAEILNNGADLSSEERCTCNDDHEATDSDITPPTSPRSNQSVASSDELLSSDSPRSSDSNREKPHKCHICSRAFRKHSALIIHHRVHSGEKPYKCSECAKQFSISGNLRRHFLIHTGERPYVCPVCSRAFNNPSHLTRHRRKLHTKAKAEQQINKPS